MRSASCGVELVAGEQPAHRVAPADLAREAQRRAADRIDAALDLDLGEARVVRRDADIGRQHQLDADGQADALDGDDHRLGQPGAPSPRPSGSMVAFGEREAARGEDRRPLQQIDARR